MGGGRGGGGGVAGYNEKFLQRMQTVQTLIRLRPMGNSLVKVQATPRILCGSALFAILLASFEEIFYLAYWFRT